MGFLGLIKDVVTAPIAIVADIATLGGTLNDRGETYTGSVLENISDDLEDLLD